MYNSYLYLGRARTLLEFPVEFIKLRAKASRGWFFISLANLGSTIPDISLTGSRRESSMCLFVGEKDHC